MGFSTSPPSVLLASRRTADRSFRTDEEYQSASSGAYALRRRCGNKISVGAQKRCAARQRSDGEWLRALAPFMSLDAFENRTQERAFVYRAPTIAPLSQHVMCVRRV